jgi:hypothetical protein
MKLTSVHPVACEGSLPHLKCSRAILSLEHADEENEHGDKGGTGCGDEWSIRWCDATGEAADPLRVCGRDTLPAALLDDVLAKVATLFE